MPGMTRVPGSSRPDCASSMPTTPPTITRASRDAVQSYLTSNQGTTVAGTLVLDAVSVHDGESERINTTLK